MTPATTTAAAAAVTVTTALPYTGHQPAVPLSILKKIKGVQSLIYTKVKREHINNQ